MRFAVTLFGIGRTGAYWCIQEHEPITSAGTQSTTTGSPSCPPPGPSNLIQNGIESLSSRHGQRLLRQRFERIYVLTLFVLIEQRDQRVHILIAD